MLNTFALFAVVFLALLMHMCCHPVSCFVSSPQASLPRPNYFSIIFSYWGPFWLWPWLSWRRRRRVWTILWVRGSCLGFMVACFRFWLLRIHVLPSALQNFASLQQQEQQQLKSQKQQIPDFQHHISIVVVASSAVATASGAVAVARQTDCVQFCIWSADSTIENLRNRRVKWAHASG